MLDKSMSRRKFLVGAGTLAGVASVAGLGLVNRPDVAEAAGTAIPWSYPADPASQPDPEKVARRAFEIYFKSGCAEAVWGSCVEALAAIEPATWGTLPTNMFRFGGGGIAGWGTICGTLNGAAAFISMAVGQNLAADGVTKEWAHRNNLINGAFQYYAETPLPTNNTFKSTQGILGQPAWAPVVPAGYTLVENAATSTANSPLCHSSLVQWTMATGAADGGWLQKDRCGKASFDVARKTIEILNKYFELASAPTVALDPSVAACGACHKTYSDKKMACGSCHDNTVDDGHMD